ncbi:hypothetical protein SAMD00019534_068510 [Acytostelium subglobosum LB1]|uniref:hypothetical protein n=1 Tax=Acytostelium subglobosum LB1 TaxID=1410327 RepID=UPI0006447D4B|nr:hypothetical protein SAMD00019534_068510 [Acytostelium subglobosum LB1]GAM23676.1 hypothetical protein SAMD00019534_068510 [Acytostelium subglobosum LB1]|eukprot:XP_012753417.1 hypothetical protein SAMD00019534_068510 [Acytostelium subglobosum LB1]
MPPASTHRSGLQAYITLNQATSQETNIMFSYIGSENDTSSPDKKLWIIAPILIVTLLVFGAVILLVWYRHKGGQIKRDIENVIKRTTGIGAKSVVKEESAADGLVYINGFGGQRVKGGTLESLVCYMCFTKTVDPTFIKVFLLAFRSFASRRDILEQLIACYNVTEEKMNQFPNTLASTKEMQTRVASIAKQWIEEHRYDFNDNKAFSDMMTRFVHSQLKENCPEIYNKILRLLSPSTYSMKEITKQKEDARQSSLPPAPPYILPSFKIGEKASLLQLSSLEVARQMTIWEATNHRSVEESEFFQMATSIEGILYEIPNLLRLTGHFVVMSNWVTSEILTEKDLDRRVRILEKLIDIANELKTLCNFNGCFEIMDGLRHPMVQYLVKTWAMLDPIKMEEYQSLNHIFSEDREYSQYRSFLRKSGSKSLPLGKLFRLDIGKKLSIENTQWIKGQDGRNKYINFDFFMEIWKLVADFKGYQCLYNYQLEEHTLNYIKQYKCLDQSEYMVDLNSI